ncbi:hypothetical protein EVAR_49116_1 [Eumeta japonica]|uniref:Uncharacterized protein n=1 Tax=Eumeta variegata TaxID=151549 RepID=A0A4C1YL25_EUMVA|nr:hypothetical protein EVAR_49116_1 [Eumeta japonica]
MHRLQEAADLRGLVKQTDVVKYGAVAPTLRITCLNYSSVLTTLCALSAPTHWPPIRLRVWSEIKYKSRGGSLANPGPRPAPRAPPARPTAEIELERSDNGAESLEALSSDPESHSCSKYISEQFQQAQIRRCDMPHRNVQRRAQRSRFSLEEFELFSILDLSGVINLAVRFDYVIFAFIVFAKYVCHVQLRRVRAVSDSSPAPPEISEPSSPVLGSQVGPGVATTQLVPPERAARRYVGRSLRSLRSIKSTITARAPRRRRRLP